MRASASYVSCGISVYVYLSMCILTLSALCNKQISLQSLLNRFCYFPLDCLFLLCCLLLSLLFCLFDCDLPPPTTIDLLLPPPYFCCSLRRSLALRLLIFLPWSPSRSPMWCCFLVEALRCASFTSASPNRSILAFRLASSSSELPP